METNGELHDLPALLQGLIGGWVGSGADLEALEKRTCLIFAGNTNHESTVIHPIAWPLYQLRCLGSQAMYKWSTFIGCFYVLNVFDN